MFLKCECGKQKYASEYVLIPCDSFTEEIMYLAHCHKCDRDLIYLLSKYPDGRIQKCHIANTSSFLKRRDIDYMIQPIRQRWCSAKGYRYYKGYGSKKSIQGGIYRLSDDRVEEKVESPLL
jgi:hypothetical protein